VARRRETLDLSSLRNWNRYHATRELKLKQFKITFSKIVPKLLQNFDPIENGSDLGPKEQG